MSELAVGTISGLAANSYVIDVASGSQLTQPGMVLQVVSATYSTQFQTTSSSYSDTGLTASITPTSASSKILVITNQNGYLDDDVDLVVDCYLEILRDATALYESRFVARTRGSNSAQEIVPIVGGLVYLDSPATTSSTTYKTRAKIDSGSPTLVLQASNTDASITLMEIAG